MQIYFKTFRIALLFALTMIVGTLQAQTISGHVKDATGEDVIGASVLEEGTKNGTVTDFNGNFTLKLTGKKAIVISYIGMKSQTVNVAGKTSVEVVLEDDATTLQDVVVVGYGTMKKSDLTGSVSSIETEKLNAKGAPSAIGNLQGAVPGVNITQSSGRAGGGFDIEIRGKSSINSDTNPIFVIDGVVCSDMDFLNPQDIERIDVLKDASSTAIYGSRATAGVVMVTTKSGAGVGKKASKPSISYDGYYGVSKVARMPDFMDANSFYNWRILKYGGFAEGSTANSAQSGQPAYEIYDMWQHSLLWKTDAENYPEAGGYSRLKYMRDNGLTFDWPDEILQDGIQQNHYLAVSGTAGDNNDVSYHFGLGYNQDRGLYKGDEQTRINFKGSVDAKITSWLTGGFNLNLSRQNNDYADDNGIQNAWRMQPYMQARDSEGNLIEKPGNYINLGSDQGNQFSDQVNTLILLDNQTKNRETWRVLGNAYLQIQPLKGLSLKTTFAPSYTNYRQGTYNDANALISGYEPDGDGNRAIMQSHRNIGYTWTNQVNFNKTFNEVHSVDLLALNEVIYSNTENQQTTARKVLSGSTWYNVGSAEDPTTSASTSSFSESSMISYALRANYTYAGKYMATATIRWDGSSKFAEGHKWGSFPSFALAWRASEENFLKNVDWLSNLKLRLSYGVTGNNSGIGNYDTQQTVSGTNYYPFGGTHYSGLYPSGIIDELLSWEESHEYNAGIDFGFLGGRINGSIDIYQKDSKDVLFQVQLPLEAGLKDGKPISMSTNIAKVRNRGIEFSLSTVNVKTKDWYWETSLNFAHNKNEVREINGTGQDMPNERLFIGQSYNPVYDYEWNGVVSDKMMTVPNTETAKKNGFTPGESVKMADYYYKTYGWSEGQAIIGDLNDDGAITEEDKRTYKTDPDWTGSFTSNLTWKNWDFGFTIYAKQGYYVGSTFLSEYMGYGDRGRMRYDMDYYLPAGTLLDFDGIAADGTYINPKYQQQTYYGEYPFPMSGSGAFDGAGNSQFASAVTVVDASFVKVKNISLGYTFSKNLLNKIGINKLRLYFNITNPFVFTSFKGFDPEWASASNKNDAPSTVTYQFGASLKF